MTPAIELTNVTKVYRRYGGRHFATLKSALADGKGLGADSGRQHDQHQRNHQGQTA